MPDFAQEPAFDALRATDYGRLDQRGDVYLDYTGGGLYAESQIRRHFELLATGLYGNPHSGNPASRSSTVLMEHTREAVLRFFNASPDEYEVIFTSNASGALKLVGESYPFGPGATYLLSYDNHNSVNGIREFARAKGADVVYAPVRNPDLRLDEDLVRRSLHRPCAGGDRLFAYPAQSNFSGVQHPLGLIDEAHRAGWDVLLDVAAFAPTNRLDLSRIRPDFVPLSFYKLFGYPTGAGALIVRKESLAKLQRPWFAGGTIALASVQGDGWYRLAQGATGFEDGTVDYLGLPAITIGLEHLTAIGIEAIHEHVDRLAERLLERMAQVHHSNGAPLFRIFGPKGMDRRGATVAFHLLDPNGQVFRVERIEQLAGEQRISVRTGCFCNPGDGEVAHNISRDEMAKCFDDHTIPVTLQQCQRLIEDATGKVPNTIRVSLGIATNSADIERFLEFATGFANRQSGEIGRILASGGHPAD
jgi:selenocysteine lyase/cysteine desulfurase